MDNFFNVLAEFFKKNKTLYFVILSLTIIFYLNKIKSCGLITIFGFTILKELCIGKLLSIENATISQTFLIIAILLTSFTVTRILLYINIISFILRLPVISDVIFYFGYEEKKILKRWISNQNSKNIGETKNGKTMYKSPLFRIKNHNIVIFNLYSKNEADANDILALSERLKLLLHDKIILKMTMEFALKKYNFIDLNDCKNYVQDVNNFFDDVSTLPASIFVYADLNPVIIRELDIEEYGYWWEKHPIVSKIYSFFKIILILLIMIIL